MTKIYIFVLILLGIITYFQLTKINYFYYEEIPLEIRKNILSTSLENNEMSFDDLVLVHILHIGFDDLVHKGELIVNKKIAEDIVEIFETLYLNNYKIEKVELISKYNGDDNLSMINNNTSAFNYRYIENSNKLSNHSYGLAIDINPFYNPYVYEINGELIVSPEVSKKYANRTLDFEHKIDKFDLAYQEFIKHGFTWGGDWSTRKDYQHFEKIV